MPRILSNSTCALRRVVREKMTSWYHRSVIDGLLYMYFIAMSSGLVRILLFWLVM